jgi:FixJ family two-component response regulator
MKSLMNGWSAGRSIFSLSHQMDARPEVYRANLMTKMQAKSLSELIRMTLAVRTAD